jgi:hypothetical protein
MKMFTNLNVISHPTSAFNHPRDVLSDATDSRAEKRAICNTGDEERRADRRHSGSDFQSGSPHRENHLPDET